MAAHILQVAYYDTLRELRVKMLEAAGYQVTSVSGNDNAMGLDGAVIAGANLIVVGFSAPHSVRAAMLDTNWLKLYEAAILEINPDKLASCIGAAEQAIAHENHLWILQN